MAFSENLKHFRTAANMSQQELSNAAGVTTRMIQQYERGVSQPRFSVAEKLANALSISIEELLDTKEAAVGELGDTYGSRAQRDFLNTAERFTALMAGGDIPQEDKEAAFMMVMKAYTIAKEKNQVFTPKKYRKPKQNDSEAE